MKHAALREHLSSVAELLRDNDDMSKKLAQASTIQTALAEKCQNMGAALEAMKGAVAEGKVQRSEWALQLAEVWGVTPHLDERSEELFHRVCEDLRIHRDTVTSLAGETEDIGSSGPLVDDGGNPIF